LFLIELIGVYVVGQSPNFFSVTGKRQQQIIVEHLQRVLEVFWIYATVGAFFEYPESAGASTCRSSSDYRTFLRVQTVTGSQGSGANWVLALTHPLTAAIG
jgi:hypothetical protein